MFRNWASDPEVTKYLTWPAHANVDVTRAVLKDWTAAYASQNYYQWAIVLKENGECPIGSISAVGLNDDLSIVHIGYCLGQRWWHRGIMSEALKRSLISSSMKWERTGLNPDTIPETLIPAW